MASDYRALRFPSVYIAVSFYNLPWPTLGGMVQGVDKWRGTPKVLGHFVDAALV